MIKYHRDVNVIKRKCCNAAEGGERNEQRKLSAVWLK